MNFKIRKEENRMKKFLAMIMALALAFSMSTVALAANPITSVTEGNEASSDVDLTVTKADIVYKIEIAWDSMDFVYNIHAGTWDTVNHNYGNGTLGWVADTTNGQSAIEGGVSSSITAVNHSNDAVTVEAKYVSENVNTEVDAGLADADGNGAVSAKLDSAADHIDEWDTTPAGCTTTFEFEVTGTPGTAVNAQKIGTITVTVTKYVAPVDP